MLEDFPYEETLLMLPPPSSSSWVLRQVKDISKRLGISFEGMEEKVEDLFREIERRRAISSTRSRSITRQTLRRGCRELKNLYSAINYESSVGKRKVSGRRSRMEGRGFGNIEIVCYDEHSNVEREGSGQ